MSHQVTILSDVQGQPQEISRVWSMENGISRGGSAGACLCQALPAFLSGRVGPRHSDPAARHTGQLSASRQASLACSLGCQASLELPPRQHKTLSCEERDTLFFFSFQMSRCCSKQIYVMVLTFGIYCKPFLKILKYFYGKEEEKY